MSTVLNILTERENQNREIEQEALTTRAKVIAVIIADANGKAPKDSAKLLNGAIDAGIVSASELAELAQAASELREFVSLNAKLPELTKAQAAAIKIFEEVREQVRQQLDEAGRASRDARTAYMHALGAAQQIGHVREEFPELFDPETREPLIQPRELSA